MHYTNNSALISIIVPVYNVEDYLLECLESISAQTYPHFECLIVDNGSTDNSAVICKQFCEKDHRFHFLFQETLGLSTARNHGLEEAKGDYLLFIDSDDVLFPEALQTAWKVLDSGPADWVVFDYIRAKSLDASFSNYSKTARTDTIYEMAGRDKAMSGLLECRDPVYCAVWNKLYSKRIIGDIRFRKIRYFEDLLFNYEVFRRTRHFIRIRQSLYFWRIRQGSLSSINTPSRYLSQFKAFIILESLSRDDTPYIRGLCLIKIYRQTLIARFHLIDTPQYAEFLSLVNQMKEETFQEYLSNKHVSLFEKTRYRLLWSFPQIMKIILKALGN